MQWGRATWRIGMLVGAMALAACSDTDAGRRTGTSTAPEDQSPGVTDDTIEIGVILPVLDAIEQQGAAVDLGDLGSSVETYVDHLNAQGGAGGRELVARLHGVSPVDLDTTRPACLAATEDNEPFAVVGLVGVPWQVHDCIAVEHAVPMVSASAVFAETLEAGQDRLFTLPMSFDRRYRAWADGLESMGVLDDRTIGIVTTDSFRSVPEVLEPRLAELGHEPTTVLVPCASTSCEQHLAAVERLRQGGVDLVFLDLPGLGGPSLVAEAQANDLAVQWTVTGDTVTDAVAQFYESSAEAFDGAIGVGEYFEPDDPGRPDPDDLACNEVITGSGEATPAPDTDEFGANAAVCRTIGVLVDGIDATDTLTTPALIESLESMDEVDVGFGRRGGFTAERHDAGSQLAVRRFDARSIRFVWPDEEVIEVR